MNIFFSVVDITCEFEVQENEILKILISGEDCKVMYKKSQSTPTRTT